MTASASFTYALDKVENPLSEPFEPRKRWTCWSSGHREDSYTLDFGAPRTLAGLDVYFFDDAPNGECRPPASFRIEAARDDRWEPVQPIGESAKQPRPGKNEVRFEPVASSRFRLVFQHAGERFYTGLYGLKPVGGDRAEANPSPGPLRFSADKFITADDILVSVLRVHNPTATVRTIYVDPIVPLRGIWSYEWIGSVSGLVNLPQGEVSGSEPRYLTLEGRQELHDELVFGRFRYAVVDDPPRLLKIGAERSAAGSRSSVSPGR